MTMLTIQQQIRAHVIKQAPSGATRTDADTARAVAHITDFIRTTPLAPLLDGEPIFTLRAQDRLAPTAVMAWASEAEYHQCAVDKSNGARTIATQMLAWQMGHPTQVKLPD